MKANNNKKTASFQKLMNSNNKFESAFKEFYSLFKVVKVINSFADENAEFRESFELLGIDFPFSLKKLENKVKNTPYMVANKVDGKTQNVFKLPKFSTDKNIFYVGRNKKGYQVDRCLPVLNFENVDKFSIENVYSLLECAYIHKSKDKSVKEKSCQIKLTKKENKFVDEYCLNYIETKGIKKLDRKQIEKDFKELRTERDDLFNTEIVTNLIEHYLNENERVSKETKAKKVIVKTETKAKTNKKVTAKGTAKTKTNESKKVA